MSRVVGADGARVDGTAGWVVAELVGGHLDRIRFVEALADALDTLETPAVLGVDIPIGHEDPEGEQDGGRRAADTAARARLGARAASVFPVPPIDLFEHEAQADASKEADRRGTIAPSAQVWNLRDRILEARDLAEEDAPVYEVHPELSFHVMSVQHGSLPAQLATKRSWNGLNQRVRLLAEADLNLPDTLDEAGRARPDDVLDAVATAWSAHRIATGEAVTFPAEPPEDPATGRPVAIHA